MADILNQILTKITRYSHPYWTNDRRICFGTNFMKFDFMNQIWWNGSFKSHEIMNLSNEMKFTYKIKVRHIHSLRQNRKYTKDTLYLKQ